MLWWTLRKFKSADPNERRAAAEALSASGDPKAGEALIAALEEKDESLRPDLLAALGKFTLELARRKELVEGSPFLQRIRFFSQDEVHVLAGAMAAVADPNVRRAAAKALSESCDPKAGEALIAALEEKDESLRLDLVKALAIFAMALSHLGELAALGQAAGLSLGQQRAMTKAMAAVERAGAEEKKEKVRTPDGGKKGASGGQRREVPRGGFGEPYCSTQCYEQGGRRLGSARLAGAAGNCAYCKSHVGGHYVILPKRDTLVFICGACAGRVKAEIQALSRCYLCDTPLP